MMTPSGNTQAVHGNVTSQVGTGGPGTRFAGGDAGPPPAINVSLGGFLLLFVGSRLLYLVLIDPSYLCPQLGEQLYVGTVAQELLTGLKLPFIEYRRSNYMLGTLVMGGLASGFFRLFGPTLFALKLAPLFLFTLALLFWYQAIRRAVGEQVARYFALLFCFSPPLLTAFSVTTMGYHSESIFFSALTVFLLFRMLSDERGSLAYPVLLGLTAGVGLWFTYIYGLTLLATLGFWLWYDKRVRWKLGVLWFALGFVVGFAPWILFNVQTHFAGLVIHDKTVWEHFGLAYLWDGLSHPRRLSLYEFFADIASDDPRDLSRRAVNLLYSLLYLGPILTAGVLRLKTGESAPTRPSPPRPTLVGFSLLYVVVFALAVQFSDFRATRYHLPAYPFLFLFVALSLARCQEAFPNVQKKIQIIFLGSVVALGLGTHAPLLSLDRSGAALSAKGYAYALLPGRYLFTHAPAGSEDREFLLEVVQRPFLSDILPKLSSDDQQELSRVIAQMLATAVPLNAQAEDLSRIERLVPPGFNRHFYYLVGATVMGQHPNELPEAVAALEFVRHRSASAHHLALIGIYRAWPWFAPMDSSPEALANAPAHVAPELLPHYWRALGLWAGRYWYEKDPSLSRLNAHLQVFVPRLNLTVQKYFLQGVGELLFAHRIYMAPSVPPAELERFPQVYQEGLLEGWGMALGEDERFSPYPSKGQESLFWIASTKGFSARSLVSIQQGKAQFEALFESPATRALEPPLRP